MSSLPSIFVSHGGPTMAMLDSPARQFLQTLPDYHEPLKAILMISAHWEASHLTVSHARELETIHDFYGFPPEFYNIRYRAHGNPALAERVAGLITAANLGDVASVARGLDHGAWLPLMLGYPDGEIPITQLSLRSGGGPDWHFRLGASLRPLRNEGILVLCSGALTHNLREIDRQAQPGDTAQWAEEFASWITKNVTGGETDNLLQYRHLAPNAARNHPTEEHLLPLFVALGAATQGTAGRHLHQSINHRVLAMDAYAWD